MPDDYTRFVIDSYIQKRAANALSPRLIHPTPAKIRAECEARFSAGITRKDQRTLNAFFEKDGKEQVDLNTIKRFDRDKFKPLANYLNGETADTNFKNIELLAWLIDLEQRPYEYGKRYEIGSTSIGSLPDDNVQEENPPFRVSVQQPIAVLSNQTLHKKHTASKITTGIVSIMLLSFAGLVTYSLQKNNAEPPGFVTIKTGEACMYWVGDHYEQTSCTQNHGDTLVVALDSVAFRNLRRINAPDTITLNAIGSVWYIKTNNKIECYTSGGPYPLDPKRKLKPISSYIIKKYFDSGN